MGGGGKRANEKISQTPSVFFHSQGSGPYVFLLGKQLHPVSKGNVLSLGIKASFLSLPYNAHID